MNGVDVTVQQQDDDGGVVCTHRPPNTCFVTNLVPAVATAYEELGDFGPCRASVASEGRAATPDSRPRDSAGFAEGCVRPPSGGSLASTGHERH
jgi:hypothetical protein